MLIGLTGGYCAGKNEAARLLEARGWACIDVDKLGHLAVDAAKDAIVARFGPGILGPEGRIDRRALAARIFADPRALADQEAIVHPAAIALLEERIDAAEAEARAAGREALVCVNAALLHRADLVAGCAAVVEVRACLALRFLRGLRRDGAGAGAVALRLWRQRGFRRELRAAAARAGRPILALRNSGGLGVLERRLEALLGRLPRPGA
ncbi:MAG TPA: dephospho-CoA kinase [Spirochaetales bacterium]|nr:dephospho-CoA kinase [Spirochaetales bacterium]HRY55581.1 dephospho-CoA kinase [Spirochaetia bacterium]HRZ63448.1 dephospho-CoA kinase [Spirochaetia bacterium]